MNTPKALPVFLSLPGLSSSTGPAERFSGLDVADPAAFRQRLADMLGALETAADGAAPDASFAALVDLLPPDEPDAQVLEAWLAAFGSGQALPGDGTGLPGAPGNERELAARYSKLFEALRSWGWGDPATGGALPPAVSGGYEGSVREWLAQLGGLADERPGGNLAAVLAAGANVSAPAAATLATASGMPSAPVPFRATSIDLPLQDPGWDRALGERVRWMVGQNLQAAELRLNPPDLGPLEVRLRVEGDRTHVSFVVAHSSVRDAVDAALPRLRELFMDGGLILGQVSVSQRDSGGRAGADAGSRDAPDGDAGAGSAGDHDRDAETSPVRTGRGMVDDYA